MDVLDVLHYLERGEIGVAKAHELLSLHSIEKVENYANLDVGRRFRRGVPEVVFGENKSYEELKKIIPASLKKFDNVVVSRIKTTDYKKLIGFLRKNGLKVKTGQKTTTIIVYKKNPRSSMTSAKVGILTGGTSDIGVAEDAKLICESMGCACMCKYDVGIAGIHRVFPALKDMIENNVQAMIVVAGMEGALPSVVCSLVDIPVIGVPTSVGYGYGEKGVAALASMLQSCTLGLSVVNIDNGIGAGGIAASIARRTTINDK